MIVYSQKTSKPSEACQHEMLTHRQLMLNQFRIAPEIVLSCAKVAFFFDISTLLSILSSRAIGMKVDCRKSISSALRVEILRRRGAPSTASWSMLRQGTKRRRLRPSACRHSPSQSRCSLASSQN